MPANPTQLDLRSASQSQFGRPRRTQSSLHSAKQQHHHQQQQQTMSSKRTYGATPPPQPSTDIMFGGNKSLGDSCNKDVSNNDNDRKSDNNNMENVNPQCNQPTNKGVLSMNTAKTNEVPSQAALTFEQFKLIRSAQADRESNNLMPPLPMERESRGVRNLNNNDTEDGEQYPIMSFAEFKQMKRLLKESNEGESNVVQKQMQKKKGRKKKKKSSPKKSSNKEKQYGAPSLVAAKIMKRSLSPIPEATSNLPSSSKLGTLNDSDNGKGSSKGGSMNVNGSSSKTMSGSSKSGMSGGGSSKVVSLEDSAKEVASETAATTTIKYDMPLLHAFETFGNDAAANRASLALDSTQQSDTKTTTNKRKEESHTVEKDNDDTMSKVYSVFENDADATRASEALTYLPLPVSTSKDSSSASGVLDEAHHLLTITATNSITETEAELPPLPDGLPNILCIPDDWEHFHGKENAKKKQVVGKEESAATAAENTGTGNEVHNNNEEVDHVEDDEDDPRNHSMWVACPDDEKELDEDVEEELDENHNLGATPRKIMGEDGHEKDDIPIPLSLTKSNKLTPLEIEGLKFDEDSGEVLVSDHSMLGQYDSNSNEEAAALNRKPEEKRELGGRIFLIRIKRKISKGGWKKVMKKFLQPFKAKLKKDIAECSEVITDVKVFVPCSSKHGMPLSPSSVSIISIESSVVTNNGTTTIIGATPVKSNLPPPELLYGAINYGRSFEESTVGTDDLPSPPPASMFLPMMSTVTSDDQDENEEEEEDALSFLAEAMKQAQSDENSVILLADEISSAVIDTPKQMSTRSNEISQKEDTKEADDISEPESNIYFTKDEHEQEAFKGMGALQIVDCTQVDGGYLLTPESYNNKANIFRCSISETCESILPGSVIGSEEDNNTPVSLNTAESVSSPSNSSRASIKLSNKVSKKKISPKSASKTRGGLVKSRISDIQQRIEMLSSTTTSSSSDDHCTAYNHRYQHSQRTSYSPRSMYSVKSKAGKTKNRMSSSSSSKYIRTVPIGIAKTYSVDLDSLSGGK